MLGRFIALEGGEGAGKTTQLRMLSDALRARGVDTVETREPGGTPGAEAIRELLLKPPGEGWGAPAEALLFAAARADHVEKLIRPALEAGKWVLTDRFIDSSRAYQGYAGEFGDDRIFALHDIGSAGLRPDLTLVIEVPAVEVARRLAARDRGRSDAIGGRDSAYHRTVAAGFRTMAEQDRKRYNVINGAASAEDVHREIMQVIERFTGEI